MASSLIAAAARRGSILKPYYSSSSSYACLFSSRNPNLELGTNPSIPSSISPPAAAFNRVLNFGAGGFDRGLGAAIMKSKFSSSATTTTREPAKGNMMEPLNRRGKSTSRPKAAASDPTRITPTRLPRAILKSKFSSARSSTRESESEGKGKGGPKTVELDPFDAIITKACVIVSLALAVFAVSVWVFRLDIGSAQELKDLESRFSYFSLVFLLAWAARGYHRSNFFGRMLKDPDRYSVGYTIACSFVFYRIALKLAAGVPE